MASTINYKITEGDLIAAPVLTASGDTTQRVELGTIVKARDTGSSAYGEAEFIYVKFTGTVNAGDSVVYDRGGKTCVQASTTAGYGQVGVSMAAQVAGQYGWVMIRGIHDAANVATGAAAGARLYVTATAGQLTGTAAAGFKVDGAYERVAASAGNVGTVELGWPLFTGNG